jgi:hypothetical protein
MEPYEVWCFFQVLVGYDVDLGWVEVLVGLLASVESYDNWILTAHRNKKYRYLKQTFDRAEVKMLREDRDKAIIDIVIDQCYETPLVVIPGWRRW